MTTPAAQPVYLDTDLGDDIDDTLTLAWLLLQQEIFDLRGISTVFVDAPRRAALARDFLRIFGAEHVPVGAGSSLPLVEPLRGTEDRARFSPQLEFLSHSQPPAVDPRAVDIWADIVCQSLTSTPPVIACIGPLTNIGVALRCYPELAKCGKFVCMGGRFQQPEKYAPEWNIRWDPEAAAILLDSGADITFVGLDVTEQCRLTEVQVDGFTRGPSPRARLLRELYALWHHVSGSQPILHDPLTLLSCCSDVLRFEPARVQVCLSGEDRGRTFCREGAPNCRIAVGVNVPRAVELVMDVLRTA